MNEIHEAYLLRAEEEAYQTIEKHADELCGLIHAAAQKGEAEAEKVPGLNLAIALVTLLVIRQERRWYLKQGRGLN